ncbi:MAG: phage/plasmid primase, P4 family [Thermoplasmatota archaeon]
MTQLLEAALTYASRGWPVFLLKPRSKEPLTPHGFKDATTNETQIRAWWTAAREANVGIATGAPAGLVVLDVDAKSGGLETLRTMEAQCGGLGETPLGLTPGGGRHAYFRHPGTDVRSRTGIAPGLDIRADGGYVVAPPSVHPNGGTYAWHPNLPLTTRLADIPAWLLERINGKASKSASRYAGAGLIAEGTRHAAFMSRAGTLRRQGRDHDEILGELLAMRERAAGDFPLEELRRIAADAAQYPAGPLPCTDEGNAKRLVALHGRDMLFDHIRRRAWLVWDGARWREDDSAAAYRFGHDVSKAILQEALDASDDVARKELAGWAAQSQSYRRLRDTLEFAKALRPAPSTFDGDPWRLNVQNGTLNLRTGELQPHAREDRITRLAPVTFDADAPSPTWDAAVLAIMGNRPEMVTYLHRVLGSALAGTGRDQVLHIWWGTGGNGKSTILSLARELLGDYAGTIRTDVLLDPTAGGANEDVARLDGLRLVTAVETRDGGRLNEALVKALTGGDKISASYKYGHVFEFTPWFTPILATNHRPHVRDDDAIWRRIRLLPFVVRFAGPDEDAPAEASPRDDALLDRLRGELPGILNRVLAGCLEWQRIGLAPPPFAKEATHEYRREEDAVMRFIDETYVREGGGAVLASDLRATYEHWCSENGEETLTSKALGARLRALGLRPDKVGSGARIWRGVRLGAGGSADYGALLPNFSATRAHAESLPEVPPKAPEAPTAAPIPLEEAQRLLRCAIREREVLDHDADRAQVLEAAAKDGIPRDRAEALLDHMLHAGAIMEPRAQRYRLARP